MLSQVSGYAATCLAYIDSRSPFGSGDGSGKAVFVKDIAEATGIPAPYLAKIVQILAKKGFVKTQRGIGGGVSLARGAETVSIFEVCAALDDPGIVPKCIMGTAVCSDERACPAHEFWTKERAKIYMYLQSTTIADLSKSKNRLWYRVLAPHELHRTVAEAHLSGDTPA